MLHALIISFCALIVLMIGCVVIFSRTTIKERDSIVKLINMAILTAGCYTGFLLVPFGQERAAVFVSGLYYLATDWLAVYLIFFTAEYTKVRLPSRLPRYIIIILSVLDSVSYLVNTYTRHAYDLEIRTADSLGVQYWSLQVRLPHMIHLSFVYLLVAYSLCILLYQTFRFPSIYKGKYYSVLLQAGAVVIINLACTILGAPYDYSVIMYGFLAMSICYFVLYASPRKLLERIHSTIVEDSVIGLFAYDNEGNCVGVNRAAKELFGVDQEIKSTAEQYLAEWLEEYRDNTSNVIGAERTIIKNGEKEYIYVNYQRLVDEKGRHLGSSFHFENRTSVVLKFKEEQYRASHDMLTGLLSRSAFEDEVSRILSEAQEPEGNYCMICSNIQDFKLINELYGVDVGDRLLIAQAEMIRRLEDESSVSARIYADKFCTLLRKEDFDEERFIENMSAVMERVLPDALKSHFYIGVYTIIDITEPVWTMCDKAMMAIDSIRGNYGQSVCYYREELLQRIMEEKEVIGSFDRAIEEEQFSMFLQPQIANDGTLVGAEALVRWIHPDKGVVSPGLFIPTLEKAGLIHRLDLYMWEQAAKKLEEWKREGRTNLSISVNISTKDFYFLDICQAFRELARKYDFDIKNLKLEITESALMKNVRKIMKNMDELHELGYDIEIDDFGSGYSSLGMLKDINADILKIDMIFLQETQNRKRSTTILKNVISMSKELGMPVITEGVETKEQVDFLRDVGCDMFQGYYFARPMSVEHFEKAYAL